MASAQNKNVAIITDWMYGGGSEKVVEQLHKIYPKAPIYTSYTNQKWRDKLDNQVKTGYLQWWLFARLRKFLPLLRQWWFARLDLSQYDLVISVTGNGEAKFVNVPNGIHVCYCNTPPHFYWNKYNDYLKNPGFGKLDWLARFGLRVMVRPLRNNDYKAAQKVDYLIGNSSHISSDIQKFYCRQSATIFPPVNTNEFQKIINKKSQSPSFIIWGRIVADKKIDIAIKACNQLKLPLTIVGTGSFVDELKEISGPTIKFTGWIEYDEMFDLIAQSSGFIFTSYEDFGIAPVEALSAGLPVIALKEGGALDYINPGKNGEFFEDQTVESLEKTLQNFNPKDYDQRTIKATAEPFSDQVFRSRIKKFINDALQS